MHKQLKETFEQRFLKTIHSLFDKFLLDLFFKLRDNHQKDFVSKESNLTQDDINKEISSLIIATNESLLDYSADVFLKQKFKERDLKIASQKLVIEAYFVFIEQLLIFSQKHFINDADRESIEEIVDSVLSYPFLDAYNKYPERANEIMQLFKPRVIN